MHNAINGSGGLSVRRGFKRSGLKVSASKAVNSGLMADVERPLPEGAKANRQSKRIPCSLQVKVSGEWKRVAADLSAGGALLLLAEPLTHTQVELRIELSDGWTWTPAGEVLRVQTRGMRYAHHIRFSDPEQVTGLAEEIDRKIAEGADRLETV